jgi:hypothetical protein
MPFLVDLERVLIVLPGAVKKKVFGGLQAAFVDGMRIGDPIVLVEKDEEARDLQGWNEVILPVGPLARQNTVRRCGPLVVRTILRRLDDRFQCAGGTLDLRVDPVKRP